MDLKLFATVFATVFLAELGDKTQLATLLYASDAARSRFVVFLAAGGALLLSTALGVLGGAAIGTLVGGRTLRLAAAVGFIAVGVWMLVQARSSA
jgi:putative Ca2+/H+ antiporter (TMEM165/GDT1 family)